MRMKKLMILAVAAIALVACSKTFDVGTSSREGRAIGFSTWAEHLTKTRVAGTNAFVDGDSIQVKGYKHLTSDVLVFDNVKVGYDGSAWAYANPRYWDHQADYYTFFAVSSPDTELSIGDAGAIAATQVVFHGNDNDVLLADSVKVNNAQFGNEVHFDFRHIAALIDLNVKKTANLADATVSIDTVTFEGVDTTATLAVAYSAKVPTVTWASRVTGKYNNRSGVTPRSLEDLANIGQTGDSLITRLIVVPQELGDTRILKISYTIKDKDNNENTFSNVSIKLNEFDTESNEVNAEDDKTIGSWVANTHYIYTLTIDADIITFSAEIKAWETTPVNGYYYLIQ